MAPLRGETQVGRHRTVRPGLVVARKGVRRPATPSCCGVRRVDEHALLAHRNQQRPAEQACRVAQPSGHRVVVEYQRTVAPRQIGWKLVGVNLLPEGEDLLSRPQGRVVHPRI